MASGHAFDKFHGWKAGEAPDLVDPYGVWQADILGNLVTYEEELNSEFGDTWKLSPNPDKDHPWEIILTVGGGSPEDETGWQFRCYMSDHHADARLVIDDYVPEFSGGIPIEDDEAPQVQE